MSDCQKVQPRLVTFLLGEVSQRESAWLAEHVRVCVACQEELASLNLTVEILQRLPREDVSAAFDRKLALRIAEHSSGSGGNSGRKRRRPPWAGLAAGVALVVLVLVPFASRAPGPEPQQTSAAHRRQGRHGATQEQTRLAAPRANALQKSPRTAPRAQDSPPAPAPVRKAASQPTQPPVVGRVLRVRGAPRVALSEGRRPAPTREGMTLRAGAVLTTGDTGQAEVELVGGSRVQVGFDTSVAFTAARASRRKAQDVVRLSSGRLWLLVPRSQRGLAVQTPQARMEALGPISAVSVVSTDRLDQSGPGLHLELTGLTTATAVRGRVRLASGYGSVIAEEGASAEATAAGAPSLLGMTQLQSVRTQAPWGQTFFEVWVADRLELDEACAWMATGDSDASLVADQLMAAGRVAEAREEYERLMEAQPDDAAALSNLGLARELEGDVGGALAAYRRAAELAPGSARLQHNLGTAYLRIGNLWRACEHLSAALEVEPELPGTRFELGRALSVLGDLDEATRQAQLLEASPETAAQGACLMGDICWLQRDMAGAEGWYLKAVQEDPSYVNAMAYLAGICLLEGRLDEAQSWTDRALALDPNSLRALNRLGLVLIAKHQLKEAEAALLRAEAAHPGSAIVLHNLGKAYLEDGDAPAAIAVRRQAASLSPDSALCRMGLAIALEESGELGEARSEYETTLRLDPTYADAAQRLAALLRRLGEPSAARLVLVRVQQYLP